MGVKWIKLDVPYGVEMEVEVWYERELKLGLVSGEEWKRDE